jgi:tellurite resistance-related uncharacterized protein
MNKMIEITTFNHIGQDERGTTTEIVLDRAGKTLSIFRKEGTVFGNHYHEGKEDTKNPEKFYLLHGKLKFEYKKVGQKEWSEIILDQPAKVDIYPNTVHRVTALTDAVMIELNSLQEHINDTLREE